MQGDSCRAGRVVALEFNLKPSSFAVLMLFSYNIASDLVDDLLLHANFLKQFNHILPIY